MSLLGILLISVTLVIVISQFGSRLAARNTFVWWVASGFILLAAVRPAIFLPIVGALGIQVVSNFVLAVLCLFLFLQVLGLIAETTQQSRRLRLHVAKLAAETYIQKITGLVLHSEADEERLPKALILLPCFNEEEALPGIVAAIRSVAQDCKDFKIYGCFVDDGSTDLSRTILERLCPSYFVSHNINIGVSGALLTGFEIARRLDFDFVVQCDSDGQHPVESIPRLLQHALAEKLDLVVGSRFVDDKGKRSMKTESTTGARITGILVIRRMLSLFGNRAKIFDPTSGFRVYSRFSQKVLLKSMPDDYPEPESIAIISLSGGTIGEVAVAMTPRTTGISSISGIKSAQFMVKVLTALFGLRLRSLAK